MNKQKCLLILPRSIFPLVCGYSIKNKNVIELLHKEYDLILVVIKECAFTEEEINYYKNHSSNMILWVRTRLISINGVLRALFTTQPLQVGYYYDKNLQCKIDSFIEKCDIAIAVLGRTVEYLRNIHSDTIMVFDAVDSIALNYEQSKYKTASIFWKIMYYLEGKRLLNHEKYWVKKSNLSYFVNYDDYQYWKSYGQAHWLPHGVNPDLLSYVKKDTRYELSVAFLGKMDYQPNVDAMIWYIKNVHIIVGKDIPLIIVGANPTKELYMLSRKYTNITITGFVKDPYIILNSCLALIAPMQTGGGIQNKVLEGMALGKINIITDLAAKPIIDSKAGHDYLLANTPKEYVDILYRVKNNPGDYINIGNNARKQILNKFNWNEYNRIYLNEILKCQKGL